MDLGLDGRVAVVSGGSRGIGRAIGAELAAEGARVVLAARSQADLDAAEAELGVAYPGRVATVSADLTEVAEVERVVALARERFGPVDIAVSNVIGHVIDAEKEGGGPGAGNFVGMPAEEYREEFTRLLVSAWALAKACVPDMRERRWGRIINIASGAAREPTKELPHVLPNTVRPAVAGLYRSLARELAPYGITVNSLLTGSIVTERNRSYWEWLARDRGVTVEEASAPVRRMIPAGRFGEPAEMAALAAFLASEPGGRVTGQSIPVDGGINRHL